VYSQAHLLFFWLIICTLLEFFQKYILFFSFSSSGVHTASSSAASQIFSSYASQMFSADEVAIVSQTSFAWALTTLLQFLRVSDSAWP
jgi:hypothetical protein